MFRTTLGLVALGLLGCAGAQPAAPPPEPQSTATASHLAPAPAGVTPTPTAAPSPVEPTAAKPQVRFPNAPFPPPTVQAPHKGSAEAGDGEWSPLGQSKLREHAAEAPRLLYQTVIHPHTVSRWKKVTVVAIDLEHAELGIIAGTEEPESKAVPKEQRPGVVPERQHAGLLAAFNGSWQARHGGYGMMKDGKVFLPPRKDACTIGMRRDGKVTLEPWEKTEPNQSELVAWRQAPSCILHDGELHPELEQRNERRWGGLDAKRKTRRRSSIALDRSGRILFYGFGEEVGPRELAEGLRYAGAHHAAQLDINYYWTRFLIFGKTAPDAPLQVTSTLVPKMEHRKRGYVSQPEPRDFFYIARRTADE